jgi:hypothetical protein
MGYGISGAISTYFAFGHHTGHNFYLDPSCPARLAAEKATDARGTHPGTVDRPCREATLHYFQYTDPRSWAVVPRLL